MKKMIIGAASVLGSVAAFAEGSTPDTTAVTTLTTQFSAWITAGGTAVLTLLGAGVAIVGAMWAFRLLKRAFNGSK